MKPNPKVTTFKKSKQKQSPALILHGEMAEESVLLLQGMRKDAPEPKRWERKSARWDHFISVLEKKDAVPVPHKIAGSIAARGRKLGYVVKVTKLDDDFSEIWFGGYEGVPKQIKTKEG